MAKLLVKDLNTGNTRPMTQKSYDLIGKKRGFKIVGHEEDKTEKSSVQLEMDRLRAEQAAKTTSEPVPTVSDEESETETEQPKQRQKPGPKPKSKAE